jgi:hypothetical protein
MDCVGKTTKDTDSSYGNKVEEHKEIMIQLLVKTFY